MNRAIVCLTLLALLAGAAPAETIKCKATRDVWLSAMGEEADYNMGASPQIKLKVWQEFGLADFDVSALKGKTIASAAIFIKPAGGAKFGLNGGSDLKWLTVSTVGHDWVEGKSPRYGTDAAGSGATFNESSYKKTDWGWPGARVYDVILGNGNTLRDDKPMSPAEGWLKAEINPNLVRALVAGAAHGLCLMDGSTTVGVNNFIAARESGNGAYLEVIVGPADAAKPTPVTGLKAAAEPKWATPELGAIRVSFTVPEGAFAYNVELNGKPVARWQIPFAAKAGSAQTFPIVDLPPGTDAEVSVVVLDGAGNASPAAKASCKVSPKLTVPNLPDSPWKPKGGEPPALGEAAVWAFPEITKVDPVSGKVLHEKGAEKFHQANSVWDGSTRTIRLAAARGEIVSFQIGIDGKIDGVKVTVGDLAGPAGAIPAKGVKLWRNWYVSGQSEYAMPWTGSVNCPMADNAVSGQTHQAVTVDLHVPTATKAGNYAGTVQLAAGDAKIELPLTVQVYDVVIPDEIHFNPELNCYGGPGSAGSAQFNDSFKLAHYHRCTINRVPYKQGGNTDPDWSPKAGDDGHVTDWSGWDRGLGPLLDGTLFAENPRAGVPVPTLYLPLFEGWPKNFRNHYQPGEGVPINGKDQDAKLKHDTLAKPIDEAMDNGFKNAWVNATADFVKHATEKGWNKTVFECYLNNKPEFGYTLWMLDEPFEYLDWSALNFFGRLWKQAIDDPAVYTLAWQNDLFEKGLAAMKRDRATFLFRGDISRMQWQGNCSDGLMNIIYLGGGGLQFPRLVRYAKDRAPSVMYAYGGCNDPTRSNWESAAWCLTAYANECDGALPWNSLGGAGDLKKLESTALILNAGAPYGHAVASFRVHALRRGAQDAELLRLLQLKNGWSRQHIGLLASQRVPLTGQYKQAFEDQAAAVTFGTLTSTGFVELKEGLLILLSR